MKIALWLILFLTLAGCAQSQTIPGEEWSYVETSALEGWDSRRLRAFERFIVDSTHLTGLVIVHRGQIVYEYGDTEENSYIASCRKSVLSMLFGKYVTNGTIDLGTSLGELGIDDVTPLLPIEKQATIQDLISARSGVYLSGANRGDFREFAPERGSVEPGSYWLYSNWDFNVAGTVFEQITGKNIYDEVEDQLAVPLQMQDWDRSLQTKYGDSTVSLFPAYHMWFSTRDMARMGLLLLNKGKWGTRQLIDAQWVEEMTKQRSTHEELQRNVPVLTEDGADLGYGYMWWLWEDVSDPNMRGAYSAQGALGQSITVYPEIDAVVAYKTKSDYRRRNSIQTEMKILKFAAWTFVQ